MLAPAGPQEPPCSQPACPGLLSPEQPFGSITLPLLHSSSLRLIPDQFAKLCQANPDASLVGLDRWQALSTEQRRGFAPLCPDLVVELASPTGASPSDEGPRGITALRQKMAAYQRNGARHDGDPHFPGLAVDLEEIWAG